MENPAKMDDSGDTHIFGTLHMSKRQNYCDTNSVFRRLGLAEGFAEPPSFLGEDPIPIPLFCMSRLKV